MPANMTPDDILKAWREAWKEQKVDRVLEIFADDVRFNDPFTGRELTGKEALRDNIQPLFSAFELKSMDLDTVLEKGNETAALVRARAKHTSPLDIPGGQRIPATNREVEMVFADFTTHRDDGRIVRDWTVLDTGAMMRQLGVMEQGRTR